MHQTVPASKDARDTKTEVEYKFVTLKHKQQKIINVCNDLKYILN